MKKLLAFLLLLLATPAFAATQHILTTVNEGTSGATLCLLSSNCTWSGLQFWTGATNTFGATAATGGQTISLDQAAGNRERIRFRTGTSLRWAIDKAATSESGLNSGSPLQISGYRDDGSTFTTIMQANRVSGPQGNGNAYFQTMGAGDYTVSRAITPTTNVFGNKYAWDDLQPTSTLGTNPVQPLNTTTFANITWTAHGMDTTVWVHVTGATAICSVTLNGYYHITAVIDANTIKIDTGQIASCSTAGGGAAVQIVPYMNDSATRLSATIHNSGPDFTAASVTYMDAEPDYYVSLTSGVSGPQYQGSYLAALSPSDNSGLNAWGTIAEQRNVVNRGNDEGFCNYFDCVRGTFAYTGSATNLTQFTGNQGTNASGAFVAGRGGAVNTSTNYYPRIYNGYLCTADALVSNTQATGGHGGICLNARGAYERLGTNPITTTNGSNVVTILVDNTGTGSLTAAHNTPSQVYLPASVTVNGTTCSTGTFAMSSVTATTFTIPCTGNASSSGAGGGTTITWLSFANDVPYAPAQYEGEFAHGLIATNAKFDDGIAINVNGTIEGTAFNVGGTAGVSCAGALTGSAVVTNGIVTHC